RDFLALALSRRPLFLGVPKAVTDKIRVQLVRVGMIEHIDTPVEGLSGGQLRRVLLPLALEPQPELLLLDEPAAGIDFKDQQKFYEVISSINGETGVTLAIVERALR